MDLKRSRLGGCGLDSFRLYRDQQRAFVNTVMRRGISQLARWILASQKVRYCYHTFPLIWFLMLTSSVYIYLQLYLGDELQSAFHFLALKSIFGLLHLCPDILKWLILSKLQGAQPFLRGLQWLKLSRSFPLLLFLNVMVEGAFLDRNYVKN